MVLSGGDPKARPKSGADLRCARGIVRDDAHPPLSTLVWCKPGSDRFIVTLLFRISTPNRPPIASRPQGSLTRYPAREGLAITLQLISGGSTAGVLAIVHFGSVGHLCGLFERSKAT